MFKFHHNEQPQWVGMRYVAFYLHHHDFTMMNTHRTEVGNATVPSGVAKRIGSVSGLEKLSIKINLYKDLMTILMLNVKISSQEWCHFFSFHFDFKCEHRCFFHQGSYLHNSKELCMWKYCFTGTPLTECSRLGEVLMHGCDQCFESPIDAPQHLQDVFLVVNGLLLQIDCSCCWSAACCGLLLSLRRVLLLVHNMHWK